MKISFRQVHIAVLTIAIAGSAHAALLKDIATVEGVRNNQLQGYGLVIGLNGTGDGTASKFTPESIANMLEKEGIVIPASTLKVKNVAAVFVTATLPPFARPGSTIDVVVSSVGDSKSLAGGTLLQVPLKAANGKVYAVAQGPLSVGGTTAGAGSGASVTKNQTTVGRVPDGAIVEVETKTDIIIDDKINYILRTNDFTTAYRAANAIDEKLGGHFARAENGNMISVTIPEEYKASLVTLISEIESVEIKTDSIAKVIVNERTGTVIIGGNVRISPCAVAHGSLTVSITNEPAVSQPPALSAGTTKVVETTKVEVVEDKSSLVELKTGTTIQELVKALNALRVTPRDLISILQAIKEADALQAKLEVI
ncbi:MAG: flagellar basal body P-ring protein FlgI [Armatimonadetes bacterium]|nr:flagellar basal body P-ring protein FlgI [Armatimonadota bacterium]